MAKGPYDDIVRSVLERLGANAPKATKPVAKSAGRTAKKAASVPAKSMTKAERSAANRARSAAERAKYEAKLAAERPAKKAARTAEAKAAGVKRANRKAEEAYGYGASGTKRKKASAYYEGEVDKINRTIDATDRMLTRGGQGRRTMLEKKIKQMKEYATKEGYELSVSDIAAIAKSELAGASKANKWSKGRLAQLVEQTKGKTWKETVDIGARRARAQELKTGKIVTGKKPAYMTAQEKDLQKRLTAQLEKQDYEKVIKKADSKMGTARGSQPKKPKKVVEQESSKRLRAAQEKNAKKSVVDPKVAAMSPAERKKFLAQQNKEWKRLKKVKPSGRGIADKDAKDMLADLGKRELVSDKRKLGPYPRIDRYGKRS